MGRNQLLADCLLELHTASSVFRQHGFAALREDWQALDAYAGRAVALALPDSRSVQGSGMRGRRNRRLFAARCAIEFEPLQWRRNQLAPGWYAMSGRRLLLDAGNSRLKWAVVEDGHWHATGQSDYSDWSALTAQLKAGTRCFVASVANPEHERQLAVLLEAAGSPRPG